MEDNYTFLKQVGIIITIILIIVAIYGAVAIFLLQTTPKIGDYVPCNENIQIIEKYKQMDSNGNVLYMWKLSDGRNVNVMQYFNEKNELAWDEAPLNTSGHLIYFEDGVYYEDIVDGFIIQNVTRSDEGVNFCKIIP